MKDLALAAGVSVMTVSRALKNHPRQSKATRQRVQQLAREMGYRPHPYVSALMSSLGRPRKHDSTVNLAVFYFSSREETIHHEYYQGILNRSPELGFNPELFDCNPERVSLQRLRQILVARGIRGILLMPAPEGFASFEFDFEGFAVAALGHTIKSPALPHVVSDLYSTTFQALEELTRRGYSRIGLVSTAYVNELARFLYSAGLRAFQAHVQPRHHLPELVLYPNLIQPESVPKIRAWIRRERLEAILCPAFHPPEMRPLHDYLCAAGVKIPQDLAYVHLIDCKNPRVTSLQQIPELMGSKAVDVVAAMIHRNEFRLSPHPQTVMTPSKWHEGKTAPVRRMAAKPRYV